MEDYTLTEERKIMIDALSHYDMCSTWRFAATGDWMIMGECGGYFKTRLFDHFGGFTPEISKYLSE